MRTNFDPATPGIVLEVKISGPKGILKIEMVLDTGSTLCIIPFEIAEALGYKPAASSRTIHITTASGTEIVPIITVNSMSILRKELKNVEVACHDLPSTARVDGLLGLSYLRNFKVSIDFKQGVLGIE